MKICLISNDATYGNCAALAEGLREFAEVDVMFFQKCPKGMDQQTAHRISRTPPTGYDHYIIVAAITLMNLPRWVLSQRCTIILTDTTYLKHHAPINSMIKGHNVWAMPDLAHLARTDNIYYQPFILPDVETTKTKLICHSPYHVTKLKQKGSDVIIDTCRELGLPLTVIIGQSWEDTVKEKARHMFCIDQIYQGLGKSGLEAMLLKCITISGIRPLSPHPPIVWTSKETLKRDIEALMEADTEAVQSEQYRWAEMNLSPGVMARKIVDSI